MDQASERERVPGEVVLDTTAHDALIEVARATPTAECCGALLGHANHAGRSSVRQVLPVPNRAEHSAREYLIAAADVRSLEAEARARGLEVVGFYHSHPDGTTRPSQTDLALAWPAYLYAIVDAVRGTIRFWQLSDDRSRFLALEIREP